MCLNFRKTLLFFTSVVTKKAIGILQSFIFKTLQVTVHSPAKSGRPRVGHAFSLVDTVFLPNKNRAFIKMYNVHPTMKLDRKYNETDRKMLEAALKTQVPDESQTTYFTYEEFFDFFEIFNLLVIPKDKLPGKYTYTCREEND